MTNEYKKRKEAQQLIVQEYVRTETTASYIPAIDLQKFTEEFVALCQTKGIYMTVNSSSCEVLSIHAKDPNHLELMMTSLNNVYGTILEEGLDNEIISPILDVIETYYGALRGALRTTKRSRLH